LPRFDSYFVNELSISQIKQFINLQLKHLNDSKLANKIITVVERPENTDYNSYLSSPLLLSMFIMTFNSYPDLPKTKSKFYWNVYDTLCTKHDSFTKHGGFQHERKTKLQNDELENILKWFAYTSLFKGKYSFDSQYFSDLLGKIKAKLNFECDLTELMEDLTVAISIIMIDGLEYKFPHKSLQEYFAALLIKEQTLDIKKEIYSKKLGEASMYIFGGNENFWNLCQELDTAHFTKYFKLVHLDRFLSNIDKSSEESMSKSFLEWTGYRQTYGVLSDIGTFMISGWQYNGINGQVLEYLNILNFRSLINLNYLNKDNIDMLIKENILKKHKDEPTEYLLDYVGIWGRIAYSSIVESGLKDSIISAVKEAELLQSSLVNELDLNEKNKIELLDL
jgi:hypothetical protein